MVGDFNFDFAYFCSHRDYLEGVSSLFHTLILESGLYGLLDLPTRGGKGQRRSGIVLSNDAEFVCDGVLSDKLIILPAAITSLFFLIQLLYNGRLC